MAVVFKKTNTNEPILEGKIMKFRSVILFLISVFMIMSACSPRSDSSQPFKVTNLKEKEPNDKIAEALTVQNGSVVKGYIDVPQDQDWYHIHVPEDTAYILRAQLTGLPKMNLKMEKNYINS